MASTKRQMKSPLPWLTAGLMLAACSMAGVLHARNPLNGGEARHARLAAEQPAATVGLRSLGEFLDAQGHLRIPDGYSGSLDPSSFRLISKPGEAPRFAKNAVDDRDRWDDQFGLAIGCDDRVNAMVATDDGRLYLGGKFRSCGNIDVEGIALWDPETGVFSALGSGLDLGPEEQIYAIATSGTELYVGGDFKKGPNLDQGRVARFDGAAWSLLGAGVDDTVYAVAISGDSVYFGGDFTSAGGVAASHVVRFDSATVSWAALPGTGLGVTQSEVFDHLDGNGYPTGDTELREIGSVRALAVSETGSIYIGGRFTTAGGVAAKNVVLFDSNGSSWTPLGAGVQSDTPVVCNYPIVGIALLVDCNYPIIVSALSVDGSGVYVGGRFTTAGATSVRNLAHFAGATWSAVGGGVDNDVRALAISNGHLYVGGEFVSVGPSASPVAANRVARFQIATSTWSPLGTGAANGGSAGVAALAFVGTDVYVGGAFIQAGGAVANKIARFNSGQVWSALGSGTGNGVAGTVNAVAVAGTDVFVGGSFNQVGVVPANNVARFDTNTQTWHALGLGVDNIVRALAVDGAKVYVGGEFLRAGGSFANRVAVWNRGTSTWGALGTFSTPNGARGGVYANHPGARVSVSAFAVRNDGYLYVGISNESGLGDVEVSPAANPNEGGVQFARGVAGWNGTQWEALGGDGGGVWFADESVNYLSQRTFFVNALAVVEDTGSGVIVYVGGRFGRVGVYGDVFSNTCDDCRDARNVARFVGQPATGSWFFEPGQELGVTGGTVPPDGLGFGGQVFALAASGNQLYVGGDFSTVGIGTTSMPARNLAVLSENSNQPFPGNVPSWSSVGNGVNGSIHALALDGSKLYAGGNFSAVGAPEQPSPGIAMWDGAAWSSRLSGGTNGTVRAIGVSASVLTIGGSFTEAAGKRSLRIARRDARLETTTTTTILVGASVVTEAVANTQLTIKARVATGGFPSLLGTVSFFDTGSGSPVPIPGCGSRPLVGGVDTRTATCPIATLRVGSHPIQARYSGDSLNFAGTSDSAPLTISAPVLVLTDLPPAAPVAGIQYSGLVSLVAGSGAVAPISYAVTAGSLPLGLQLTSSGDLIGTPSAAGAFTFIVTATDASTTSASGGAFSGSRSYPLTVARQPTTIAITGIAPATGVAGAPYQVSVTVLDGNVPNAAPATGQVSCSEDGGQSFPATVNLGEACQLTSLNPGIKQIAVRYADTANVYATSSATQEYTVNAAPGGGTVTVDSQFAFPGATVAIPISFAGVGGTESFSAEVDFGSNRLVLMSVQGANGATCTNQSGRISVAKSSTTALPSADTTYCVVTARVVEGAASGPIPLPVLVTTQPTAPVCTDEAGLVRRCSTQDGQVVVAAFDPRPIDGASIVIAGYASTLNQTRTVRVLNRSGDAHHLTGCAIAGAGLSYAPLVGPNPLTVAAGTTAEMVLSCQLPAVNTEVSGTFECTTDDIARPVLRYPVICKTLADGIPLPYEQLLDIERREGEQIGFSVDRSASTGGAITVLGAPFGGVDGNGRVLMYQDSSELPGLANAIASLDELGTYKLGQALALRADGSRLAIGAPGAGPDGVLPGRVLLFDRPAGGWAAFDPNTSNPIILEAPGLPGGATLEFGAALAYAPNGALIVGAPGSRTSVGEAGAIFIYPAGELEALPPVTSANVFTRGRFGAALAVNDDQLVVGAPGEVSGGMRTGAAYLITLIAGKPTPPTRIIATEPLADLDKYGSAVAISDNLLVVGAAGADKAMVFQPEAGGAGWLESGVLQPPPGTEADQGLGTSLSISSAIAINGELSAPQAIDGDAGKAIAINGELVMAGAPMADASSQIVDAGKVYLYTIRPRFAGAVSPDAVLDNASAKAGDEFGRAVVLGEGAALVGVPKADLVVLEPPPPPSQGHPNGTSPTTTLEDVGRGETFVFDPVFADGFE